MKGQAHNLKQLTKCPICNTEYNRLYSQVLKEDDFGIVFHMTCPKCETATLLFVPGGHNGAVSVGVVTDLNEREANMLFKKDIVKTDNILRIYKDLNS